MTEIEKLLDQMEPQNALTAIASVANRLFAHLSDKERLDFVESLIGDSGTDKISSMVSL